MNELEKLWNYIYYITWHVLNRTTLCINQWLRRNLIWIFGKKVQLIDAAVTRGMNNDDYGINLGYAFAIMYQTTIYIIFIILINLHYLDYFNINGYTIYHFFGIIMLAYFINYLLLWRKDKFKKYFKEFQGVNKGTLGYIFVIFIHVGSLVILLISLTYYKK